MKKCELCNSTIARMYCDSDEASLCWDCDTKVHTANFLVAKHSRTLLCHACQSPTPWTGSGPKLGPTVSVCETCARTNHPKNNDDEDDDQNSEDQSDEDDDSDDDGDDGDGDGDGDDDDDDDDGDNQVVPLSYSSLPPPPLVSSSCSEESSSKL
ncbi:hypothetical protein F0562_014177 [Nyssa sinensis]|uniref:B box-type domain-containing protein n=1 Tax=Nyssa sinensis TaxID=561372 RepID=A0A5J4ZM26_9ASTE|nr:hypothetical protein F0562_014177 [Nyssa sinensis]